MDGPFDSAPIEEIALHHAPLVKVVTQVRFPKCCRMEVRAWSGISGWELVLPDGGVGKVEPAGAVQGFLGRADRQAAGQHRILVAVPAGQVDGEPPQAR